MSRLRNGMWVRCGDDVGILVVVNDVLQFHKVAEDGTTSLIYIVNKFDVTQAAYSDIPECRRPTEAVAKTLGYI